MYESSFSQIPSHSFPVKEVLSGSEAFASLGVGPSPRAPPQTEGVGEGRRKGSRSKEEIALIVFWQVRENTLMRAP